MERQAGIGEHEIHGAERRKYDDTEVQAKTSGEPLPTTSTITKSQTDTGCTMLQDVSSELQTAITFLVGKLNVSQNQAVKEREAQDKFLQSCGRYRHDIIPDGNSLYRAVAESVYGDQSEHLSLRQQTLSYIQSVGTYHLNITGKPHQFFSSASLLGDWTKVTEIAALSSILEVNIHVLTCDKDCIIPQRFQPCHFGGPETKRHIYISWLSTGHFDAIVDEQKPNPEHSQWYQQLLLSFKYCVVQESDMPKSCSEVGIQCVVKESDKHKSCSEVGIQCVVKESDVHRSSSDIGIQCVVKESDKHKSCSEVGIQTSFLTEEQTRSGIDEFNALLLKVANDLGRDDIQRILLLCPEQIKKAARENIMNGVQLLLTLKENGCISREDVSFLIDLLTTIKRKDLVDNVVKPNHLHILSGGITWIKMHLRKKYKKHYENFKPIPWNDNMSLSLTKLYTRLKVTESNKSNRFEKGKILENEKDIFSRKGLSEDYDERIKIEGAPGMGKSTFCRKLAYDWACGELPHYQLLFLLEMRHVSEISHQLQRIIFDQLLPDDAKITKSALLEFIDQYPNSVLFLFDGLDEMKFRSNIDSSVIKTIRKKQFSWCTVVTTTRPHECDFVLRENDVQFMIEGFSVHDAMEYINRYFNNKKKKAHSLIYRLKLNQVPLDRSPSPYFRNYEGDSSEDTNDDDDDDDDDDNADDDDDDDNDVDDNDDDNSDDNDLDDLSRSSHEMVQRYSQRNAEDFHIQHDLLCNPLHVAFVCLLWEDKRCIPTNMTDTYTQILECILRRYCCKEGIEMPSGEIPKRVQDDVNSLASLAYKAMFEKNMILNETDVPSRLLSLGLLVRDTGVSNIKPEKLCFFYHKTWLEYFAALNFCNNVDENVNDMESTFEQILLNEKQVGLFVAGILKDKAKSLLPVLGNKMVNTYRYILNSDVCSDFCEYFRSTCAFLCEAGLAVEHLIEYMPDVLILSISMENKNTLRFSLYSSPAYHLDHSNFLWYNEFYTSLLAGKQCGWMRDVDQSMSKEILSFFICQKKHKQKISKPGNVILYHDYSEACERNDSNKAHYTCRTIRQFADHRICLQSFEGHNICLQAVKSLARALKSGWCLEALKIYNLHIDKLNVDLSNLFRSINDNQHLKLFELSLKRYALVCPLRLLIDSGPEHVSIFMSKSYCGSSTETISQICEFVKRCKKTRSFSFTLPDLLQRQIDDEFLPALKSASPSLKSINIVNSLYLANSVDKLVSALNANIYLRDFKLDICTNVINYHISFEMESLENCMSNYISLITKVKYLESLQFQLSDDYKLINVDKLVTALLQHSRLKHFCLQTNYFKSSIYPVVHSFERFCKAVTETCYNAFKCNKSEKLGLTSISLVCLSHNVLNHDNLLSKLSQEPFLRYMTFTGKRTNIYCSEERNLVAKCATTIEINFKDLNTQEMT